MKSASNIQAKFQNDILIYSQQKGVNKEVDAEMELISQEIEKVISPTQPEVIPTFAKVVIKQGQTFHGTAVRLGISRKLRELGYAFAWEVHKKISTLTVAWADSKASFLE